MLVAYGLKILCLGGLGIYFFALATTVHHEGQINGMQILIGVIMLVSIWSVFRWRPSVETKSFLNSITVFALGCMILVGSLMFPPLLILLLVLLAFVKIFSPKSL